MSIYSYLKNVEKGRSVFWDEVTLKERLCVWVLQNVFPARYWKDVYVEGCRRVKESADKEVARYAVKLESVLRLYAAHIGEPAYSMTWNQSEVAELNLEDVPQPDIPELSMSDAEFNLMMRQGEPEEAEDIYSLLANGVEGERPN